jgi:hypothetical protein
MNLYIRCLLTLLFFSFAAAFQSHAQGGGGIPLRVVQVADDPTAVPRCINSQTDRVWLTLRRVVTNRSKGWFTKDADVSIVIKAQVKTDPPLTNGISYPLAANARFGDAPFGQVSVPVEYTLVSGLVLKQDKVSYSGLGVDVSLVNTKQKNGLGSALQALVDVTSSSKLPIPASPYTQAASYLLKFANTAIDNEISKTGTDDKAITGSLAFNFDPDPPKPDGSCNGKTPGGDDFETTGTKAFLSSDGVKTPTDGAVYVDINQTNDYCWTAELTPAFVLKAARKDASIQCSDPNYKSKFKSVSNNYVGLFLNKRAASKQLGPASPEVARDRQESRRRCLANGIGAAKCPGA